MHAYLLNVEYENYNSIHAYLLYVLIENHNSMHTYLLYDESKNWNSMQAYFLVCCVWKLYFYTGLPTIIVCENLLLSIYQYSTVLVNVLKSHFFALLPGVCCVRNSSFNAWPSDHVLCLKNIIHCSPTYCMLNITINNSIDPIKFPTIVTESFVHPYLKKCSLFLEI